MYEKNANLRKPHHVKARLVIGSYEPIRNMGAAASHEETVPSNTRPPPLGARPTNTRLPTPFEPSLLRDTRRDVRPVEYRPPVQQSHVVRNVVTLHRPSLTLVRASDPNVYLVQFDFTAEVEGFITIFYAANEIIEREHANYNSYIKKVSYSGNGKPGKTRFGVGKSQRYRQNDSKGLDVREFANGELRYKEGGTYPVVIRLEVLYNDSDTEVPEGQRVRSQTTFAELVNADGEYKIQIVAQHVLVGGTIYRMQEMYGIGGTDITARKEEDAYEMDSSHDCVICLTEPSNTAVQPCNHLCLCDECARILGSETEFHRRKCPVCRTQLVSFLRIITGGGPSDESSGDTSTVTEGYSARTGDGVSGSAQEEGATMGYQTIAITDASNQSDANAAMTGITPAAETSRVEGATVPTGPNAV